MPGYGVPVGGGALLPFSYAEQRLAEARNYWLSTVGADGRPHLMIVWAVWLDGRLLFSTGQRSKKARNLRREARCSIAPQCPGETELVVLEGAAEQLSVDALGPFVAAVSAKYDTDMSAMLDEPVFAVRPEKIVALDDTFAAHATRWTFSDLER